MVHNSSASVPFSTATLLVPDSSSMSDIANQSTHFTGVKDSNQTNQTTSHSTYMSPFPFTSSVITDQMTTLMTTATSPGKQGCRKWLKISRLIMPILNLDANNPTYHYNQIQWKN